MEIRELILKNFGKFSNQSFQLTEGINIVYGENEFGKSTIHSFIKRMLFGVDQKKNTKDKQNTIGKYEPWDNKEKCAGSIQFTSGRNTYLLYREFDQQGKMVTLSSEAYRAHLNAGQAEEALDALLGKVDGVNYENTVSMAQRKIETAEELAGELKNYAANYHSRGTQNIQLEEVQQYLNDKKREIENQKNEQVLILANKKEKLTLEYDYIKREIERLQALLKENQKLEALQRSKQEKRNVSFKVPVFPCVAMFILMIPAFVIVHRPWNVLTVIVMILALGLYIWNKLKHKPIGRQVKKELTKEIEKLAWENSRYISELQEKEIILEHVAEQMKKLSIPARKEQVFAYKIEGIELAISRVEDVSHNIQKDFGLLLNEQASDILSAITDGKYERIAVSETLVVHIYQGGKALELAQVSRGTVEQVYFAIRMAITNLLHTEELPVLLDDTFAYYDDVRLISVLKWLVKHKRQVIIFTCHKREEQLLKEANMPYHMV